MEAIELEQDLGVRARPQRHARAPQLRGQLLKVVDLPVEHQHDLAVRAQHRLVGFGRQVDDRQAGVAQRRRSALVNPRRIRAAVMKGVRHRAHERARVARIARPVAEAEMPGYAAHGRASASKAS